MTTQTAQRFHLPDVGEGLTEAEIVTWHVGVGDTVEVNQTIVEIETAKSLVELPSPFAGLVVELLAAEGDTVPVGTAIIAIGGDSSPEPTESTESTESSGEEPRLLVGYGARDTDSARPRRRRGSTVPDGHADGQSTRPRAKPPVRKLAEVLNIDLATVTPSGNDGIVVRADVLAAAKAARTSETTAAPSDPVPGSAPESVPESVPAETRIPIKGLRKQTASAVSTSAFTAPHVSEFVSVDMTETLALRQRVIQRREFRDVKATPLVFVARAYLHALRRTPMANARWDDAAQEIVLPAHVNLGIAAATPRGLVVPNITGADRLDLRGLAVAISELADNARASRSTPASMTGGTTTITNIGVFGVDTGTPILNPGETAILAVGTIRRMPWVVGIGDEERIEPRSILQLALSFDHRVLDGREGSQLLADTAAILTDPTEAFLS